MGRLNLGGAQAGQITELQKLSQPELPVTPQPEAEAAAGPVGSAVDQLLAAESAPPAVPTIAEGVQAGVEAELAAEEAGAIPHAKERFEDAERVDRWIPTGGAQVGVPSQDGGFLDRARNFEQAVNSGVIRPGITPTGAVSQAAIDQRKATIDPITIATAAVAQDPGSLTAAINRAGAVNQQFVNPAAVEAGGASRVEIQNIDPAYLQLGSLVTENMIYELASGEAAVDPDYQLDARDDEALPQVSETQATQAVSRAQGNDRIGQQIHKEYQRFKNPGRTPSPLSQEEATTLGHAFKAMYAAANPDIIKPIKVGDQVFYQLTAEGQAAATQTAYARKRMFPQPNVRPLKQPGELPGDIGQETRDWLGAVKRPVGAKILKEAAHNMNKVANVVDTQRAKILFSTILPVLAGAEIDPRLASAFAHINNIGDAQQSKFNAAEQADLAKPEAERDGYSAENNMRELRTSVAQNVRAIATERKGANHITYAAQAFNGRLSPQQTAFDPSASKAVRFVTRNAVPANTSNPRVERNLRQMYAMMLVKGAGSLLPRAREEALVRDTGKLRQWGARLIDVLDNTMSDAEYEQIAQAIEQGLPLTDQAFQGLRPLALDPETDAELLKAIKDKGEEGPHFIDGLIDFAKYEHRKRAGKPHTSYFNAYMDGKTNGIAANAIQLGVEQTARQTGVLRDGEVELLDDGDIRDALKEVMIDDITMNGWEGATGEVGLHMSLVGKAVASHRDLNKKTTMTFGYGKDTDTFLKDIDATVGELEQIALKAEAEGDVETLEKKGLDGYVAALAALREAGAYGDLVEAYSNKLDVGLRQVMSPEAIEARGLMRSAAVAHAMMNQLFTIGTYTGYELNLGKNQSLGWDEESVSEYDLTKGDYSKRLKVGQYKSEPTAAAEKTYTDKATGETTVVPGGHAYGGSLPAPIQSLDAATVALSVTGNSWKRLTANSGGNPYVHSIYDAFKVDAMGYDVLLEETNKNWLKAGMEWSYLRETHGALQNAFKTFNENLAGRSPSDPLTANERLYMDWALKPVTTLSGKTHPMNLVKQLDKTDSATFETNEVWKAADRVKKKMADAGYDWRYPPKDPTVHQLKAFVYAMRDEMNISSRLSKAINKAEAAKKDLAKKIKAAAPKKADTLGYDLSHGAQYYEH